MVNPKISKGEGEIWITLGHWQRGKQHQDCYITIETSPFIADAFTELNTISIKESVINVELLKEWDNLENDVLHWFNNWWFEFVELGNDFVLTAPIQITRLKEASNDRLIGLKVTFSFNFYRFCNP